MSNLEDRHIEAAILPVGDGWNVQDVRYYANHRTASHSTARSILAHAETLARVEAIANAPTVLDGGSISWCRQAAAAILAALQPKDK